MPILPASKLRGIQSNLLLLNGTLGSNSMSPFLTRDAASLNARVAGYILKVLKVNENFHVYYQLKKKFHHVQNFLEGFKTPCRATKGIASIRKLRDTSI